MRDPKDGDPAPDARSTRLSHMIIAPLTRAPPRVLLLPMSALSNADVYDALSETRGNIGAAARILGVDRRVVAKRADTVPELQALIQDFRECMLDTAEDHVRSDVEKGEPTACRFVLQTVGKDRGYSTGVAGTGKGGSIVVELRSFEIQEVKETPNA